MKLLTSTQQEAVDELVRFAGSGEIFEEALEEASRRSGGEAVSLDQLLDQIVLKKEQQSRSEVAAQG